MPANFWETIKTPFKKARKTIGEWFKKKPEEKAMAFEVGAGMTEEERKKAETKIKELTKPIEPYKPPSLAKETALQLLGVGERVSPVQEATTGALKGFATGMAKGLTLGYWFPEFEMTETEKEAARITKTIGELEGWMIPFGAVAKGVGLAGKLGIKAIPALAKVGAKAPLLAKIVKSAMPFAAYRAMEKPTEGETREQAMKQGLIFGAMFPIVGIALKPIAKPMGKIAGKALQKVIKKPAAIVISKLPTGEQNILRSFGVSGETIAKDTYESAMKIAAGITETTIKKAPEVVRTITYELPPALMPVRGKATWKHSKILWNSMRNQFGQTNKLGTDMTKNRGTMAWVIDTLQGGKRELEPLMKKYEGQGMTRKQYKKLYAMFKAHDYNIEGYKKVMATVKGIEPVITEKTIIKAAAEVPVRRNFSVPATQVTDAARGGTWYTSPESKLYDFAKIKGVGGKNVLETRIPIKKPLTIPDAELEMGSFNVVNISPTYEKLLPIKERKLANQLYLKLHGDKGIYELRLDGKITQKEMEMRIDEAIADFGLKLGMKPKEIAHLFRTNINRFDAMMDKIISQGLRKRGYDALIIKQAGDTHYFKFAEAVVKKVPPTIPPAIKPPAIAVDIQKYFERFIPEEQKFMKARFLEGKSLEKTKKIMGFKTIERAKQLEDRIVGEIKIMKDAERMGILPKVKPEVKPAIPTLPSTEAVKEITPKQTKRIVKLAEKKHPVVKEPAEKQLEFINEKAKPVVKAGKVKAPTQMRLDEIKPPPPGKKPPIEEVPLPAAPEPPRGSNLAAIDKMVEKVGRPTRFLEWLKGIPRGFKQLFTDRFSAMKTFEDDISKLAGKPIDITKSPYVEARLYAGRIGTIEANLSDLQKIVLPLRKQRADFTRFVLSKRAIERASRRFKNPGGVTLEQGNMALAEIKTKVGNKTYRLFERTERAIQNWADKVILKPALQSGIISKKAYEAIITKNKHWLPFQVVDYLPTAARADLIPVGTEIFSVSKQQIIKGLKGTEKTIRDPFEAIIDRMSQATSLTQRNNVARKLIDLRKTFPAAKELIKPLARMGKEGRLVWDLRPPKGWDSISVFIKGRVTKWAVPEGLGQAMHSMNEVEAGMLGGLLRLTSTAFRRGATTFYIPFSLSNAFRDAQMAVMCSKWGFNPADWLHGFGAGLKGAYGWESKLYRDFHRNRGGFGGFIQTARAISGTKKALFEPTWWKKTKAVINPLNLISNFAEAVELAPRLGVYRKGIIKGVTPLEAAYEARRVTIDFARAGQEARILNMWIPFVNARWQALLNTARVFREHPVRSAARATAFIVTPGVTTYYWNTLNYPDLYDDIPQWVKDTYFIFIVGEDIDARGNRVPKLLKIPKGDVGQIFYNPIEYALEYVRKGEPANWFKLGLEWMSQLAPIPFTRNGEPSASSFLAGALPPAIRTPIEVTMNKVFFTGYPIVPRRLERVAPSEQYDERTPELAITIGRALGISPMKLAYGLQGLFGGLAREAIDPVKILDLTKERFYRASGGEKRRQAWELADELTVGYNTARLQIKTALEQGRNEEAMAIMNDWNRAARTVIPDIQEILREDYPDEAEKLEKKVTFQLTDIQRIRTTIQKEITEVKRERGELPTAVPSTAKEYWEGVMPMPATIGEIFTGQPAPTPAASVRDYWER